MIGLGTGSLYKHMSPVSPSGIQAVRDTGTSAIELNAVLAERLNAKTPSLLSLDPAMLDSFEYVSMHAPNDVTYADNAETRDLLDRVQHVSERLSLDRVVFHPDRIENPSVFLAYDFPRGIENMDARKPNGQTVADLTLFIEEYGFGFVYDATHVYTNDATMALSDRLLDAFGEALVEAHCSGYYIHGGDEQQHFPAVLEEEYWNGDREPLPHNRICSHVPSAVPVIVESVLPQNIDDAQSVLQREYQYMEQRLF